MMTPIKQALTLPDKCPIKQIQGKVTQVYEMGKAAGKDKQSFMLQDAVGGSIRVTAWQHSDLSFYAGKEVILSEGPKGGLSVNVFNGKTGLNFSSTCSIQVVAGSPSDAPPPDSKPALDIKSPPMNQAPVVINGAKIGMMINNAVLINTTAGIPCDLENLKMTCQTIEALSKWMEQGGLVTDQKTDNPY